MRVALVLVLLLAPLALADHVFSHRLVIEGRLIDANAEPIPNRRVQVHLSDPDIGEPCPGGHDDVTDAWGDFWFCYHVHDLQPGSVTVAAGLAVKTRPLDFDLRRMVFYLRDDTLDGAPPPGWNRTFHLDGRLWERGATRLDGVNVSGVTLNNVVVNVSTVNDTRAGGDATKGSDFAIETDGYGDYRAIVRLYPDQHPEDIRVTIRAYGTEAETTLDRLFHRSTVDFRFPIETAEPLTPPGTTSGPISVTMLLATAAATWLAFAIARRKG